MIRKLYAGTRYKLHSASQKQKKYTLKDYTRQYKACRIGFIAFLTSTVLSIPLSVAAFTQPENYKLPTKLITPTLLLFSLMLGKETHIATKALEAQILRLQKSRK